MPVTERPTQRTVRRVTSAQLVETCDRIQRAIQHVAIRLQDFAPGEAVPFLQEASAHALTLNAMIRTMLADLDAVGVTA